MSAQRPSRMKLGVMATARAPLAELNRLARGAGCQVLASVLFPERPQGGFPEVDAWLVDLDWEAPGAAELVETFDTAGIPVIYDEDLPIGPADCTEAVVMRQHRERRLADKLKQLVREHQGVDPNARPRARYLWVLGASTGGPEAVAKFLNGIDDDLEGVAFIYAQHIEQHALGSLQRVVAKHSRFKVETVEEPKVVRERTIYVVSPGSQLELLDSGVLTPSTAGWSGRYKPSIDQVIAKVARVYGPRGGAIVFSGMGDDGSGACKLLHHRGGRVWVQSRESCTIDSMPAAVEARGCAQFAGTPGELASQLVSWHRQGHPPVAQTQRRYGVVHE